MKADFLISTSTPELPAVAVWAHPTANPAPIAAYDRNGQGQERQSLSRGPVSLLEVDAGQVCDLAALGAFRLTVRTPAIRQSLSLCGCHGRVVGDWCELRDGSAAVWIRPEAIAQGQAYVERETGGWRRGVDYFDAQGRGLLRLCLTSGSDFSAFDSFCTVYADRPGAKPDMRRRQPPGSSAADPWRSSAGGRRPPGPAGMDALLVDLAEEGLGRLGSDLRVEAGCAAGSRILLQIAAENELPLQINYVRPGCVQSWNGVVLAPPGRDGRWRSADPTKLELEFDEQQFGSAWILDSGSENPGWLVSDPSGRGFLSIHLDESQFAARAGIPVQWPSLISYLAVRGRDNVLSTTASGGRR